MFSVDGRNVERILINEFVRGSSHSAACPVISANQLDFGHNIYLFLQKPFSFILKLGLPKWYSAFLPGWWRFWMPPDQCSLRTCKLFFACQLLYSFDLPYLHTVHYSTREVFFLFPQTQVHSHSMRALIIVHVNYQQGPRSEKISFSERQWKTTVFVLFFFQSSEKAFFLPVATSQMAPVTVGRIF